MKSSKPQKVNPRNSEFVVASFSARPQTLETLKADAKNYGQPLSSRIRLILEQEAKEILKRRQTAATLAA